MLSTFSLSNPKQQGSQPPLPPTEALANLLKVAGLDINEILTNISNPSLLKSKIDKANRKIGKIYENKWSQSKLHLHYDAQADLIKILTQQQFASKIIYTTHLVGCLPEDLGTGVKLISPLKDREERSTIKNSFWVQEKGDNRPSVLPLLFGMGASQLVFMAIRECVFVEGGTDMLLLPTLFRQATQRDYLGFQIVQGIAEAGKANFGLLQNHAPKVAFLVDNDDAGTEYVEQLKKSTIDEKAIFMLPHPEQVLEDYLDSHLYLQAVNEQIKNWNKGYTQESLMSLDDLPQQNRPQAVKKWYEKNNLENKPNKTSIAYYLLDLATGEEQKQIVENQFKNSLVELYEKINAFFSNSHRK